MKDRIKKVRQDNRLSMEKFGERIKITKASISRLESGENSPSDQTITLICKEFGINEDWLRYGTEPMKKDIDMDFSRICAEIGVHDEKAKEAILKYSQLSESDKELFWKFAERFMK